MSATQHENNSHPSSPANGYVAPTPNPDSTQSQPHQAHIGAIMSQTNATEKHRRSFSDLRHPPSPRAHRQPSISSPAFQELIDNPPARNLADPKFAGRDWRSVKLGELTKPEDLKFVDDTTPVEVVTNLLVESEAPVLLLREQSDSARIIGIFDYNTLNAYLLMVLGLLHPSETQIQNVADLIHKARSGNPIPLKDVKDLGRSEPLAFLSESANLVRAIETFGRGEHRILVTSDTTNEVIGVLSQGRLLRFLWENGRAFPPIEQFFAQHLRDLKIGSNSVVSVNGDQPLHKALTLMADEGVSSLAVIDNARHVIGNISTVDVRLLTKSSSLPLLENTCIHFISVILSTRGMFEGKDSFPVFHVTPLNTLAHTVAKLAATKSHRLWVTEPVSPSSSGPPSPPLHSATMVPTSSHRTSLAGGTGQSYLHPPAPVSSDPNHVADASPKTPSIAPNGPSISASSLPGVRMGGQLVGVVSLTDILILFARAGGMDVADPNEIRMRRRSTILKPRASTEIAR